MFVPLLLLVLSLGGVFLSLLLPGYSELLLIAGPATLASLYILLKALVALGISGQRGMLVLDGSNVMHWRDETPSLATLLEVLDHLSSLGFTPGVVFDANAGYKIEGKYLTERAFARKLGLPRDRVMVVAKGNPADPILLGAARDLGARVVSNDRFRDWQETHPEINEPGHLIRGGYRDGRLWLDI